MEETLTYIIDRNGDVKPFEEYNSNDAVRYEAHTKIVKLLSRAKANPGYTQRTTVSDDVVDECFRRLQIGTKNTDFKYEIKPYWKISVLYPRSEMVLTPTIVNGVEMKEVHL
jgi:hypothetical protein